MDWVNVTDGNDTTLNSTTLSNNTTPLAPLPCSPEPALQFLLLGIELAVPAWEAVLTALALSAIILLTVVGNILVILSVFTHKPLRIVQNFFIVSLAVADLTVAILVLPLNVAYSLVRRWLFGIHVCKLWLTCDVLCCTASILNLCAIALDRYWAITDPINYAQKRTVRRVLLMIAGVWLLSLLISSPPLAGWNDWPEEFDRDTPCQLTSQRGYVVYSSLGSFYIPLVIMTLVYIEIFVATKRRLRERAKASSTVTANKTAQSTVGTTKGGRHEDEDSLSSDQENEGRKFSTRRSHRHRRKRGSVERRRHENLLNVAGNGVKATGGSLETNGPALILSPSTVEGFTSTLGVTQTVSTDKLLATSPTSIAPPAAAAVVSPQPVSTTLLEQNKSAVHQFIEERQRISLSKERRAARTLGIIMGVFVVCWLPFFLMYVIVPFCPSCCPSEKLVNFITWLGYVNSALNPIIYTIFNLDFRRAFKKLLHIKS